MSMNSASVLSLRACSAAERDCCGCAACDWDCICVDEPLAVPEVLGAGAEDDGCGVDGMVAVDAAAGAGLGVVACCVVANC